MSGAGIFSLVDQTILVTGASSGIGRATAVQLSDLGAVVVATGRNSDRLGETISTMSGSGHRSIVADISTEKGIGDLFSELSGVRLNGLVHAAGTQTTLPLRVISAKSIQDELWLSAGAATLLMQGFAKNIRSGKKTGAAVLISSVMGLVGARALSLYSAGKASVIGLARSLALELAPDIRVNVVAPGFVKTPMFDELKRIWTEEQLQHTESEHPLGFGQPKDVAAAIAFLLSGASRWITGITLPVDGGYTAH